MAGRVGPSLRNAISMLLLVASTMLVAPAFPARAQSCLEWRLRSTTGPSPRGEFGFAYDSKRGMSVLVGGAQNLAFNNVFRETWEWNGTSWTLVSTLGPTRRCDNAMSYDGARKVVVSFGGYDGVFLRDTWVWNGQSWVQKSSTGPTARADASMAFDPTEGTMVLFGGLSGAAVRGDTWRWDGTVWTQQAPATSPPARWIHRMGYDAARDEIVVFGGASPSQVLGDTWVFTGTDWSQRTPLTLPPARYGNAVAYDSDRQLIVMFGGQTGFDFGVGVLGDIWEWNGTDWSARAVSGPPARSFVKMVYDQRRRKIVLFGGYNGAQFVNDTWELGSDLDIVTEPVGLDVSPGGHAELHVVAGGTGPFSYQWLRYGSPVSDGVRVFGSTTDTLVIDPTQTGDTGEYTVAISNACGPVSSRGAMLLVGPGPGEAKQVRATYDKATGVIGVTYTSACAASDHTIHFGPLAALATYGYSGAACHVGTSGSTSFNPGTGNFFFLIAGDNGTWEGSYGRNGAGVERAEDASSPCGLPRILNAICN